MLRKIILLILMIVFITVNAKSEVIKLSPEKVAELARTQSLLVKTSKLNIKAQESALKSAGASFFPTLSGNISAMHIYDKPQMELGGGGGSFLGTSIPVIPGVTDLIDGGDVQLLNLLANSFSNMKIETPNNIYNGQISIAQPIFTGGKIFNGYRATKLNLEAQKFLFVRNQKEASLTAQKLFWGYVGTVKGLEAISETAQWLEKLVSDQRKMFENNLIIELDVLNTTIQLDNFKLTEEKMKNSIQTLTSQFLLFLGLPQNLEIDVDTSMLAVAENIVVRDDSIDIWIENREDLKALSSQINALEKLKKIQLGSYFPNIAAFGSYGANNQYSNREEVFKKSSSIGIQANWTIIDWGKAWQESKKIDAQIQTLKLQRDNMREMIRLKYKELYRKVEESKKSCLIAKEDLETAQKALRIAKLKYDSQSITNTELLNARNQLTGKMVAYTQARINIILAKEEFLTASLGGSNSQQMSQ